jgi:hypothetical protein
VDCVKEVKMKKLAGWLFGILLFVALVATMGCKSGYRSTSKVSVSGRDVVYLRDPRTDLCFAVLAVQNPAGTSISEVAMTGVPCEKLAQVQTQ